MLAFRSRLRGTLLVVAFAMVFVGLSRSAGGTALDDYVAEPDPSYTYSLMNTIAGTGYTGYVLNMTSQIWRSAAEVDRTLWQHWLIVVVPDTVNHTKALLFIDGGDNGGSPPTSIDDEIALLAAGSQSVVADLRMVPNQPLTFIGDESTPRWEDALIAYTWDKYLRTGDDRWPARLPMTKAAVRAMDTVEDFCSGNLSLTIDGFVVAGASKRGWTTWTTAAVDTRVEAIIPIVIDVLNVEVSMRHHYGAYGFWAPAIQDYVDMGIMDWMGSPELQALMDIVDPYVYRDRFTMPKYLVNSTGDQFFLPDSAQFYFDDLPGEKYLRYVPNTDHGLGGSDAAYSVLAYYQSILYGTPRPQFSWTLEGDGSIRVQTVDTPAAVNLWQATNTTARDFRRDTIGSAWTSSALADQGGGVYVGWVSEPATGWTAFFIELVYDSGGPYPFRFTTQVRVLPEHLPHPLEVGGDGYRTSVGTGDDEVPVVVVSGTPHEMGYHYGTLMKDEVQAFIPQFLEYVRYGGLPFSDASLDAAWYSIAPYVDDRYKEELDGLAAGAEVDYLAARRALTAPVVASYSCSSIAVWDTATADGHLYQSRNLDWDLGAGAHNYPAIVVYIPDENEGVPHVNVTFAGMVGSHTGMNAEGIVLAEMGDSPWSEYPFDLDGNHFATMFREILYDAHSLTEAVDIITLTQRIKRYHYVVGDGKNELAAVKIKAHAPETPPDDLIIWTDNDSTDEFYPNVIEDVVYNDEGRGAFPHIQTNHGTYDQTKLIELANSIPIVGSNVVNVVYDATDLELWVAYAEDPDEAYERPYVYFGLTALDADGDGIADTDEGGGDPDDDGFPNYLDTDSDGDGHTDGDEVAAGTDPYDPTSVPPTSGGGHDDDIIDILFNPWGTCFIATAAYGTTTAEEVGVLCDFRDRYLLTTRAGTAFVRAYYRFSPPVARFIASHETVRRTVRALMAPVVAMVRLTLHSPAASGAAVATVTALALAVCVATSGRRVRSLHRQATSD